MNQQPFQNAQTLTFDKKYQLSGMGIKIAILDTGIDRINPNFNNAVAEINDFCDPHRGTAQVVDGLGSHLAGIIGARGKLRGVAPESELHIGRIMTHSWLLADAPLTRGISWATLNKADIISISCGFKYQDEAMQEAIQEAHRQNIIVVAAIGNNGEVGEEAGGFPARWPVVISVGSVNSQNGISEFTDENDALDVLAPGENIESVVLEGKYEMGSGTSQATAFVSGFLCLALEFCKKNNISYSPAMIRELMVKTGKPCEFSNGTYPILDPMAMINYLQGLQKQ